MGEAAWPKPLPDEPPWIVRAYWAVRAWVTWPAQVRQMKAAGFRHTGFMTWETGPPDELGLSCYRSLIGVMVHGPGCSCPEEP